MPQRTPTISISESPSRGTSNPILKVFELTHLSNYDLCGPIFVLTDSTTGEGNLHRIIKGEKNRSTGLSTIRHIVSVTPDPQTWATCSKFEIGCTTPAYYFSWNAVLDRLAKSNEFSDQPASSLRRNKRTNSGVEYDPEPMVIYTAMSSARNHLIQELHSSGVLFENEYCIPTKLDR